MGITPFPQIQIRQTPAKLGIDADLGKLDIKQPRPAFEMRTTLPKLRMKQPPGKLRIDQSRAWDALGLGNNLETMHRIYTAARQVALRGIARRVEEGNQLAAIHLPTNAIADIAEQQATNTNKLDFVGYASVDNVDIFYTARKPVVEVNEGSVRIDTYPQRPEIHYHRGKLDMTMLQYHKVDIIPPQIDRMI